MTNLLGHLSELKKNPFPSSLINLLGKAGKGPSGLHKLSGGEQIGRLV